MANSDEIDLINDEVQEVAHEFAVDLNCVVISNHRFALEGITRAEDEEIQRWEAALALQDREVAWSVIGHVQNGYEELRKAANCLALVGLITRLQHWITRFVKQEDLNPKKTGASMLSGQLDALNGSLGDGPVPASYFEDLVNVRDSIVHHDSRAEWNDRRGARKVADHHRNASGDVEFSEEQLKDAVDQATRQVRWSDEKLHPPRAA